MIGVGNKDSQENFHIYDPKTQRHYLQTINQSQLRVEPFRFAQGKSPQKERETSKSVSSKKQKANSKTTPAMDDQKHSQREFGTNASAKEIDQQFGILPSIQSSALRERSIHAVTNNVSMSRGNQSPDRASSNKQGDPSVTDVRQDENTKNYPMLDDLAIAVEDGPDIHTQTIRDMSSIASQSMQKHNSNMGFRGGASGERKNSKNAPSRMQTSNFGYIQVEINQTNSNRLLNNHKVALMDEIKENAQQRTSNNNRNQHEGLPNKFSNSPIKLKSLFQNSSFINQKIEGRQERVSPRRTKEMRVDDPTVNEFSNENLSYTKGDYISKSIFMSPSKQTILSSPSRNQLSSNQQKYASQSPSAHLRSKPLKKSSPSSRLSKENKLLGL